MRPRPIALIPLLLLLWTSGAFAAAPVTAPPGAAYQAWRGAEQARTRSLSAGALRAPNPVNLEHLRGQRLYAREALPASFDLRTQTGKLSPVRDQGGYGLCWAFGAYASLESTLRPGNPQDLSEWHLGYRAFMGDSGTGSDGFTNPAFPQWWRSAGGDDWPAVAVLARISGPVTEAQAPYPADNAPYVPTGTPVLWVRDVHLLPAPFQYDWLGLGDPSHAAAVANLKGTLMRYGAVSAGMNTAGMGAGVYRADTWAFYYSGTGGQDHGVSIVGWDDAFPRDRFAQTPPGDGAWIVRNSWGSDWGDRGYFYVSYHDTRLSGAITYTASTLPSGIRAYQHDPLGWTANLGFRSPTAWMANRFTASAAGSLVSLGFYASSPGTTYEMSLFLGGGDTPGSGTRASGPVTGTFETPGWHVVDLPAPVDLAAGQRFDAVVRLTCPGTETPLPAETAVPGYSERAAAAPGQSYLSPDGSSWQDLTATDPQGNLCLKAFVREAGSPSPTSSPRSGGGGGCDLGFGAAGLFLVPLILRRRRP